MDAYLATGDSGMECGPRINLKACLGFSAVCDLGWDELYGFCRCSVLALNGIFKFLFIMNATLA
jgi:hypothetical protein